MIKCTLIYGNRTEMHLSQIFAGFQILKENKIIILETVYDPLYIKNNYNHSVVIEARVGGKVICYDLADGYQSFHNLERFDEILEDVFLYFKRSSSEKYNRNLRNKTKIRPLGLNYQVSAPHNPFDKFYKKRNENIVISYLNYLRSYKRFHHQYFYQKFEHKPNLSESYRLLYNVRLYNKDNIKCDAISKAYPALNSDEVNDVYKRWRNDLEEVTVQRIETVRSLKNHFGSLFEGGISKDEFSIKVAPDLLISNQKSNKFCFMDEVKKNYICISTRGLHHSIGWKFAEYVAASKAILTDNLEYELPGNFKKGQNYVEFGDSQELLRKAEFLLNNISLVHEIETNNQTYYNQYLNPEIMILNSLKEAGIVAL